MPLHRRLYRSLLQTIRLFDRDKLPLLGLAGPQGQQWLGEHQPTCRPAHVINHLFRHPPPGATPDQAFTALRILGMQHQTLVTAEDQTRDACSAWRTLLHQSNYTSPQGPMTPTTLVTQLMDTSLLIRRLHEDAWPDVILYDAEHSWDRDAETGSPEQTHHEVRTALNQHGLSTALDAMAARIKRDHPQLFADPYTPAPTPTPSNNMGTLPTTPASHIIRSTSSPADVLSAVQQYIYRVLKLRHEPIEWLYDGLGPLVPDSAIANRKGAPFILAVVGCMLCDRLGLPTVPIRSTPHTPHVSPGQTALSGGALMPDDVAARQAGRAASYLPTDGWLLATVEVQGLHQKITDHSHNSNSLPPAAHWILSGVFLDVGVRGGAVIGCEELQSRYPEAFHTYMVQHKPVISESVYLSLCAEWMRSMLIACQRRGESDLVAHWLVQLLALDPTTPEWAVMLRQQQM